MSWLTLPEKPTTEDYRAINTRLLIVVLGIIIVSVLFYLTFLKAPEVSAAVDTLVEDDFDSYGVGTLYGQDNWGGSSPSAPTVSIGEAYSSPNSVWFAGDKARYALNEDNTEYPDGQIDFYFYALNSSGNLRFYIYHHGYSSYEYVYASGTEIFIKDPAAAMVSIASGVTLNAWHKISIQWEYYSTSTLTNRYRANYDNGSWSSYYTKTFTLSQEGNFDSIELYGSSGGQYYVDDIGLGCGKGNCASCSGVLLCQNAGCCWDYLPGGLWLPEGNSWCGECTTGECGGDSIYDCQYCLTPETCTGLCYWATSTESCLTGHPECGAGTSLFLCDNSGDCTTNGGYWYEGSCWTTPEETDLIDWATYYAQYGDYPTSSDWIASIASTTTGLFKKVNSFMGLFDRNFDLGTAQEKGHTFGGAIPLARGYLQIIDAFLGNLPVGELLVFVLLFMMCVGIFRLIKGLVQLLHIW